MSDASRRSSRALAFLATRLRRLAAGLALAGVACVAPACASTAPESSSATLPPLVSAGDLAARLGLERRPPVDGKIVLAGPSGAGEILIFPETTVVSVHGTPFTTSEPVRLRGGDAWLTKDDASSIESLWVAAPSSASARWEAPRVKPLDPRLPKSGPWRGPSGGSAYTDQPTQAEVRAWTVPLKRTWNYIVIHHSASASGSAAAFDAAHKQRRDAEGRKWDGLGYDFVIGNGNGSGDGTVEVGYRWREQKRGAHAGVDLYNEHGVGICLVGDFTKSRPTAAQMSALSRLCNFLSGYCGIKRENYMGHGDVKKTECPGPLFPRDFFASGRTGRLASSGSDSPDSSLGSR